MSGFLGDLHITGGHIAALLLTLLGLLLLLLFTARIKAGRTLRVRPLPAFERLPAELGSSAESGAPLHFAIGSGDLGGDRTLSSIASLQILEGLAASAAAYGTPPIVTVGDPTLLPLAQDILRRAYARQGTPKQFEPATVRFVAAQPVVYAAGAADVAAHEGIHGNVLAGSFEEEVSLIAHGAEARGLVQTAASDGLRALGALYPASTLLAAGEELYAGPTQVGDSPHRLASLRVQDALRYLLVLAILLKALGVY